MEKEIRYELNRMSTQIGEISQDLKDITMAIIEQQENSQISPNIMNRLRRIEKR